MKFFHGVNKETRALIKRSSRKVELTEAFKMSEISSISTLEVAWENRSLWRRRLYLNNDEIWFCVRVAHTNKLELLKWAREEKKCEWDKWTICGAARQGNLEMVKYCKKVSYRCVGVCRSCLKWSSRGTQILSRRRQSALALWYCQLGGYKWSSSCTRIPC